MKDIKLITKFEKMINLVEGAKDISAELGEDLLNDALQSIISDLNDKYDEYVK